MTKRAAGMFLTDGEAVLLLRRAEEDHHGEWGLPGGKVKARETFLGGAQREVREETGRLPGCRRLGEVDSKDGDLVFRTFVCRVRERYDPVLSDEHSAGRWVPLGKVSELDLHPKFRDKLAEIMRLVRAGGEGFVNEMSGFAGFVNWGKA